MLSALMRWRLSGAQRLPKQSVVGADSSANGQATDSEFADESAPTMEIARTAPSLPHQHHRIDQNWPLKPVLLQPWIFCGQRKMLSSHTVSHIARRRMWNGEEGSMSSKKLDSHHRQAALRRWPGKLLAVLALSAGLTAHAALDENDLLLLDVRLERLRLASSITAYQHEGLTLVSLAELGSALEFPFDVDPVSGQATGWFLNPSRRFSLDLARREAVVDGQTHSFSAAEVQANEEGVFVDLATFSRWFPVDLQLDLSNLRIEVSPREQLPVQVRAARRQAGSQISALGPASMPEVDNDYRVLGRPVVDLGLSYSIRRNKDSQRPQTGFNYSALLAGDVAWMDGRVYMSGNRDDALSDFRASLVRDRLQGPFGLRYVEIGDIVPPQVTGAAGSSVERGILIQGGGSAVGRDDLIDGDAIRIAGDALEGWDVELFQNGMRVGFQSIGPDGRYSFDRLEPLAGENQFELVFYGPNGEERREQLSRYSGLMPDQPGSVRYQLAVSEKGEQLHDANRPNYAPGEDPLSNRGTARYAAGVDVRVLPQMSLRAAWNSAVVDDVRNNYYSLGTRIGLGPATLGVDATRGPEGSTRWDASFHLPAGMKLWGFDTRFEHSSFVDYIPPDENEERLRNLSSRTGLTLQGPLGPVTTRFSAFHNRSKGYNYNTYIAGFTSYAAGLHFGSNLAYDQYSDRNRDGVLRDNEFYGDVFFSTRSGPLSLRGGASYRLEPERKVDRYYLDSTVSVAQDLSMNFGLSRDPLRALTRFTAGFNWHLPQVILSPRVSYDSKGDYSGFVYATLSMGSRPDRSGVLLSNRSMANAGTVVARVYVDKDGSGSFTPGDLPLPKVRVRAPQAGRNALTDEEGIAQLSGLGSDRATDVAIDEKTLPDPSLRLLSGGNSVLARATTTTLIDFPLQYTGSIDGFVHQQRGAGQTALPGAMVELVDGADEVIAFKVSGHDGFFVFEGVPYGSYQLRLGGSRSTGGTGQKVTLSDVQPDRHDLILLGEARALAASSAAPVAAPARNLAPLAATVSPTAQAPSPAVPVAAPTPTPTPAPTFAPVATPVQPVVVTSGAAPAAFSAPALPASGKDGRLVQLGAFGAEANAERELAQLRRQGLLDKGGAVSILSHDNPRGGRLYRILMSPGALSAAAACGSIKARGGSCITVDPATL